MPYLFLGGLLFFSWIPWVDLHALAKVIHHQCLDWVSFESRFTPIYKALICGERLAHNSLKVTFVKGGLIHLMVVSGAHLVFLEKMWMQTPFSSSFKKASLYFLLTLYALGTQFHPPVMRALFSFYLFQISQSQKLFFNPVLLTHLSSCLCLLYNPAWIHSASLQLSWLASLCQNFKGLLKKCFWTYVILLPLVSRWQTLHPLTVLINWLLAPLIGGLLFPLSFMSFLLAPLHHITDALWMMVLKILDIVCFWSSESIVFKWSISQKMGWTYLILVLCVFYCVETYSRKSFYKKRVRTLKPKKRYQLRWKLPWG